MQRFVKAFSAPSVSPEISKEKKKKKKVGGEGMGGGRGQGSEQILLLRQVVPLGV